MLNEKTLELNISTEFLSICRRYDPYAFLFGTTLRQESYLGYDCKALGRLPLFWRTAVFQFKRALQRRNTHLGEEYTFQINNNRKRDQHLVLYLMSGGRPSVSLYILPMFITLTDVRRFSPNLIQKTFFVDVTDIPPWLVDNRSHRVLAYPHHRVGVILSERKQIKLTPFEEMLKSVAEKRIGIALERLLENLKGRELEGAKFKSKRLRFTFQIFPSESGEK